MENRELKTVDDAIAYVKSIIFWPGFTFRCSPIGPNNDMVELVVDMDVIDTDSFPTYDVRLPEAFNEYVTVKLSNIPTTDHLGRVMIDLAWTLVERTWFHEAREFFRVRGVMAGTSESEWFAPFHPHHYSDHPHGAGIVRWDAAAQKVT